MYLVGKGVQFQSVVGQYMRVVDTYCDECALAVREEVIPRHADGLAAVSRDLVEFMRAVVPLVRSEDDGRVGDDAVAAGARYCRAHREIVELDGGAVLECEQPVARKAGRARGQQTTRRGREGAARGHQEEE
jgi:hypothetical protein